MKLKSVELVNALSASFEQLQVLTQTSVNINQNVITAEQGNFLLFARFIDTFYIEDGSRPSDQMVFEFFKTLTDDYEVADLAALTFNKTLEDAGYILDDDKISFIKGALDEVSLSDAINTKDFGKLLRDTAGAADAPAKHFSKPTIADGVNLAGDVIVKLTELGKADVPIVAETHYYDFGKSLEDAFSLGETHFVAVSKPFSDTVNGFEDHVIIFAKKAADDTFFISQALEKDYAKPLSDSYSLSDGHSLEPGKVLYDVVAGVGDQAFVFTKKVREDVFSIGDQINTFAVGKSLADTPVFLEAHHYDMGKPLADTFAALEAHSLEPGKVLYDDVAGIGSYVFIFTKKAPDDTFAATDEINTFAVGKPLTDNSSFADQINTIYFDKAPSDTAAFADAITSFGTTKQLYSAVNATDDIDGTASILDDQEMQFVKQRTDVAFIGDSIFVQKQYIRDFLDAMAAQDDARLSSGKTLSDAPLASDSTNMVTGKQIYDIPVASETLAFALARIRSDSALLGDAASSISPERCY